MAFDRNMYFKVLKKELINVLQLPAQNTYLLLGVKKSMTVCLIVNQTAYRFIEQNKLYIYFVFKLWTECINSFDCMLSILLVYT